MSETPRACVVGWPIKHSRSPIIHNYWLKLLDIEGVYEKLAVPPEGFAEFAASVGHGGLRGANVTVPHKEAAFAACDIRTEAADRIGAVNTLWRENGKLCGDNTDASGFLANLDQEAPGWRDGARRAVLLGAGGAARALIFALTGVGVEVTILNRTFERGADLARSFPGARVEPWDSLPRALADADLLVNTTSAGMAGAPPLDLDLAPLPPTALVTDIVYVPLETELLRGARARGLRTAGGLGMLLHQAAPSFARWFGIRPEVTEELRRLVEADVRGAA